MDAYIKYISYYIPERKLNNTELSELFPEWDSSKILNKIGIEKRGISAPTEFVSNMATKAIDNLCQEYNIQKSTIDFLILCTQSPDYFLPTTACIVQDKAGLNTNCGAIDINQGCSGFIYGLSLAKGLIAGNIAKNILLVTSEMYTKHIHPDDKGNRSIFGDASAATLISTEGLYKLGEFSLGSDGKGAENLIVKNGALKHPKTSDNNTPNDNFLHMNGSEIFIFTARTVPELVSKTLEKNDESLEDIDQFLFHQANTFMLETLRKKIRIPEEKFVIDMKEYGNTVSSTIPIALKNLISKSENKNKILLTGFGVGYSWGAVTIYKNE